MPAFTPSLVLVVAAIVYFGGLVKGVAGFGYAIAGTALLATVLTPATAVVVMIVPMVVANLALLGELERDAFVSCVRRFWPFVGAAMVGTVVGMLVLEAVPSELLTGGLGAFTLVYVVGRQSVVTVPGQAAVAAYCFRPGTGAKAALGFVSGVVFGASNVAVQVVAYLDSLALDRALFVGVLSMILVGISGFRVGLAWWLGLYESGAMLLYSVVVAVPGLVGVVSGRRLRDYLPTRYEEGFGLVVLIVIGVRLLSTVG